MSRDKKPISRGKPNLWPMPLAILTISVIFTMLGPPAMAQECAPQAGLNFICGLKSPEDIVNLPGTPWILASGRADGRGPGQLHVVNAVTKAWHFAYPDGGKTLFDRQTYPDCPGLPDPATFSTNGLALRTLPHNRYRLYAANHGSREAIEFFDVSLTKAGPSLTWIGCAVMPPGTNPNALAPLPGGGFVVASMNDPRDPDRWAHLIAGAPVGSVWRWMPGKGFSLFKNITVSGGNGVEVAKDGRWIYVSAWASGKLVRFANSLDAAPREVKLDFLPDNLRWGPHGLLLIAGQIGPVGRIASCTGNPCPSDWVVDAIDPVTMAIHSLVAQRGNDVVNYASGALLVGDDFFITVRGDGRMAYIEQAKRLF